MVSSNDPGVALPRRTCLRDPIPEIEAAAQTLSAAVSAHLMGDVSAAEQFLCQANCPAIRAWTESIWGAGSAYIPKGKLVSSLEPLPKASRTPMRMPSAKERLLLHGRDGYRCRFCGIPVVRKQVRQLLCAEYPHLNLWGRRNIEQHAALQAMWAQYDHVVPHAYGGGNDLDNLIVTCAPCNFGRMELTLQQANLADPRARAPLRTGWDGLERLLQTRPTAR